MIPRTLFVVAYHDVPSFAIGVYATREETELKVARLTMQEENFSYYEKKYGRTFDSVEDLRRALFAKPTDWVGEIEIAKVEPGNLYDFRSDAKYWEWWSLYDLLKMLVQYRTGELSRPSCYADIFPYNTDAEESDVEENESDDGDSEDVGDVEENESEDDGGY